MTLAMLKLLQPHCLISRPCAGRPAFVAVSSLIDMTSGGGSVCKESRYGPLSARSVMDGGWRLVPCGCRHLAHETVVSGL